MVEVTEAKKGLDAFYSIRGFLVAYCLDLLRVNFNSFCANDKPKVLYCVSIWEFALDLFIKYNLLNIFYT